MKVKKKNKLTMSKKIMIWTNILFGIVIAFSFYAIINQFSNLDPLAYIIPSVGGMVAVTNGFYFNKSGKENTIGGIIYDTAMNQMDSVSDECEG